MISWVNGNKDLLALVISLLALVVGLVTIWIAAHQARLQTYARMHEALINGSASTGRRLLFTLDKTNKFPLPTDESEAWDHINQALATYDTLGVYFAAGLVPRRLVLRSWHHPLKAILGPARAFVAHRTALGIKQPWNGLNALLDKAEQFKCNCDFCKEFRSAQPIFQPL
jgi:hypothetical protein